MLSSDYNPKYLNWLYWRHVRADAFATTRRQLHCELEDLLIFCPVAAIFLLLHDIVSVVRSLSRFDTPQPGAAPEGSLMVDHH